MEWEERVIVWDREAVKELHRLDRATRERILEAVARYADSGYGDVRKLVSYSDQFRLRVGDWRIRFVLLKTPPGVQVLHVLPRGGAYRDE